MLTFLSSIIEILIIIFSSNVLYSFSPQTEHVKGLDRILTTSSLSTLAFSISAICSLSILLNSPKHLNGIFVVMDFIEQKHVSNSFFLYLTIYLFSGVKKIISF